MKVYTTEAKTLEDALDKIVSENNLNLNDILYKKSLKKGHLLKSDSVVVDSYLKEELITRAINFIIMIAEGLKASVNCEAITKDERTIIQIYSENKSVLIGKNGQTLKSIENMVKQKILSDTGVNFKIMIDVENYRENRDQKIIKLAIDTANEVLDTKISVKLDSMTSYERRLVHDALNEIRGIRTYSEGEEPNRYTVIETE